MPYLKDEEPVRIFFLLLLVYVIYTFVFQPLGFLRAPALRLNDAFSALGRTQKPLPGEIKDIVVVAVDTDSLKRADLRWPWSRRRFAEIIKKISSFGPKAIFLDFAFLGKSDEEADYLFAQEIKKAGNVVLAGYIEDGEYLKPIDILASCASGVGLVNKVVLDNQDLRVRDVRLVFALGRREEGYDFGAEVKTLAVARGVSLSDIRYQPGRIIFPDNSSLPVDMSRGSLPINYSASADDFTTIAVSAFFDSKDIDPSLFKDKIVLMGATADIIHDIHSTPIGKIPGIYINAASLLMLMSGTFLKVLPRSLELLIFLVFIMAVGFISFRFKAVYSFLILSAIMLITSFAYLFAGIHHNFSMDIFSVIFLSLVSYFMVEAWKYVSLIIQSEKIKLQAIIDPDTGLYTQRYFQLSVETRLQKKHLRQGYFFGLIYINEFSRIEEKYPRCLPYLIKLLSEAVKGCAGKNLMLARYGQDAISLCLWDINGSRLEKMLSRLTAEISGREFIVENEQVKLSVRIAALELPREHINSYSDLVLTCEALFKRIGSDGKAGFVIFDPAVDRVVRSAASIGGQRVIPKNEFAYVSLDLAARNKELEGALDEIRKQQKRIEQLYFHTMHSLVKALEEKDPYTAGHSERVGFYATELAKGLNLSKEEVEAVNKAAYLHDIGKIGLPDAVLHKKEKLDENDFAYIKRHMADGAKILEGLPFCERIVPYVLHHHERYDGRGYPHGLSGEMIPVGAQIIAIADSFDAMTTGRGYNKPLRLEEAIEELKESSGVQFNPAYVNKFIELLGQRLIRAL